MEKSINEKPGGMYQNDPRNIPLRPDPENNKWWIWVIASIIVFAVLVYWLS